MSGTSKGNYITQAWLVIFLAVLYGGGLAAVQIALSGKIAENKRNETYSVIPSLIDGAIKENTVETLVTGLNGKDIRIYEACGGSGARLGWIIPTGGQGFADRIEVLIAVNADVSTIAGIYVLDQKETPGLGDYITGQDFRSRFAGKPTGKKLVVVKSDPTADNEIRALTGATISSESVSGIVNDAIANLKEPILNLPAKSGASASS